MLVWKSGVCLEILKVWVENVIKKYKRVCKIIYKKLLRWHHDLCV